MNFPVYNPGETVSLDAEYANASKVTVVRQTPNRVYTTVKSIDSGSEWDVMTNRLTKVDDPNETVSKHGNIHVWRGDLDEDALELVKLAEKSGMDVLIIGGHGTLNSCTDHSSDPETIKVPPMDNLNTFLLSRIPDKFRYTPDKRQFTGPNLGGAHMKRKKKYKKKR